MHLQSGGLFALIFVLNIIFSTAYRPQEIILYENENYSGKQKSFYESHPDLRSDSVGRDAKSHCVVRGLWRVMGTFWNPTPQAVFMENVYGDEKSGKVCGSWNNSEYKSILLVGSQDLDTPAIQFHAKPRFYGEPDLYLDGRILRLAKPINVSSYGFTGRQNWTVFRSTNLTGHSECLIAEEARRGAEGVTFNINKTLTVGSIWRGCGALDPIPNEPLGRQALEENQKSKGERRTLSRGVHIFVTISLSAFLTPFP